MAHWSDLPNEIRFQIFQYLFVDTITSYSESNRIETIKNIRVLELQLVSRSFARGEDVVGAMLSSAVLRLNTGCDLTLINTNSRYREGLRTRLRTIEITRPISDLFEVQLWKLQSLIPLLNQLHIRMTHHPELFCQVIPTILVHVDVNIKPLLKLLQGKSSIGGSVHPLACKSSSGTSQDRTYTSGKRTIEVTSNGGSLDPQHPRTAIERALLRGSRGLEEPLLRARWLTRLLTDVEFARDKIEVTLSWQLKVKTITINNGEPSTDSFLIPVGTPQQFRCREYANVSNRTSHSAPRMCAYDFFAAIRKS